MFFNTRKELIQNIKSPKDIACGYIEKNMDQPGLESRFINDYIGKMFYQSSFSSSNK